MAQEGGDEDFSRLSIADRLSSKIWKARVSAYNELTHTFKTSVSEDAPEFSPYLRDPSVLVAAVKDANAVAQESGIVCACAFVEYGGKSAASTSKEGLTSAIVEKNILGSARAGTKKAAIELCLLLVECDNSADTVIEACIEGLKSKQPKAVAGSVSVLKEVVKQFGAKVINVKPILKVVPSIFGHADKGVRAEGAQLVQELHRWLGSALDPCLSDLKPVQQKELAELFSNEEPPSQTRFTRLQQRDRALKEAEASLTANDAVKASANDASAGIQQDDDMTADAYDLSEPQNILDRLPADFYVNLASAKWKERKELALDPLLDILKKTHRLQDGNYDELVRSLAGRMTDANIACVISASGCIEALAKGLRQNFARYKPATVPLILERCKEKKVSVTDALGRALDAILQSLSISDLTEDIETFAKHKNPQVKEQAFRFLVRSLQSTRTPPSLKTDFKPLSDALLLGLEDSFAPVRDAAAEGLGTMHKLAGDRVMAAVLERLDDIKKNKVLDFSQKAVVKCKANSGPSLGSAPAPVVAKTLPGKSNIKAMGGKEQSRAPSSPAGSDKENGRPPAAAVKPSARNGATASNPKSLASASPAPVRKPQILSSMKKLGSTAVPTSQSSANTQAKPKTTTIVQKSATSEPLKYRFTQEDAEVQLAQEVPQSIQADLKDSAWKTRLAALDTLQSWLEGEGANTEAELIVRMLAKTPGWKESNFQIYGKMASILTLMAQSSATWTRACSALTIGPLTDKLGDIKIKKPASDALIAYAESFSLQFVLSQAYEPMTKQKAPKYQSEALLWIEQSLRDFGINGLAVRELVEFLKAGLKSSNATVRTSSLKTLVTLRLFVGSDIKGFLQELNPTLLSTIDSEFDKVNGQQPPIPTRTSADHVQALHNETEGSKSRRDPLDDLFPRKEISKLVSPSLIKMMSDANWKQRKEALETLQSILEANPRLVPTLGDLGTALKQRLPDSNKVVQGLALDAVARLANAVGKPFERSARLFVAPICGILADAKATVRAPALVALSAIHDQCGLECMITQVACGLEPVNPLQRSELASWLSTRLATAEAQVDLAPLVGPVVACLEDKSGDVRKAAQSLLPAIISSVGFERLMDRASALKPASRSVVIPMLETAKAAGSDRATASGSTLPVTDGAASLTKPLGHRTTIAGAASIASKGLPAVTRSLRPSAPGTGNDSVRGPNPLSRPVSSSSSASAPGSSNRNATHMSHPSARSTQRPSSGDGGSRLNITAGRSLFRASDASGKQNRAGRETGALRWLVEDTARPDQIEYLQQQMISHTSPELMALMFSRDHNSARDHAEALTLLTALSRSASYDELEASTPEQQEDRSVLLANSDLVLKYITIRLCDHSSSIVLGCLDLVEALFHAMLSARYYMTDYEASCFLPSIVAKLGETEEPIRMRARGIIRSFGTIYPSSKVFAHLLEHGTKSKSVRTRAESIEELGYCLRRQGWAVCQPRKALPEIASFLSEKDVSIRTAALNALAEAYRQVGDELFEYVQNLQPREQTILDERLRRTDASRIASVVENADSGTPQRSASRQSFSTSEARVTHSRTISSASRLPALASAKRRMSALPTPSDNATRASTQTYGVVSEGNPSVVQKRMAPLAGDNVGVAKVGPSPPGAAANDNFGREDPFALINSHSINESVDALKLVQKAIVDNPLALLTKVEPLITAITHQMTFAFDGLNSQTPQTVLRLCKHLMQTLSGFFDQRELSSAVPKAALAALLGELTKRLLETADSGASDAIVSLSKVLNMVLIRIFHNSDNSACFGSLFMILENVTVNLRELKAEELASRAKYAELVMKCLWKISKSVKENLENGSLDPKKLLLDIDKFLQAIPPAEWRRRASDDVPLGDMPLRTVKTVLQQIVASYGESVYQQLSLLEKPENSFVYQYLFRLLNNSRTLPSTVSKSKIDDQRTGEYGSSLSAARHPQMKSGPEPQRRQSGEDMPETAASASMSPGRSNDIQMNLALKDIFDKIGNAQESKKGIAELYQFKLQHPEYVAAIFRVEAISNHDNLFRAETRINTWIAATGSFFQSYLRRALSNLAAEEAERNGLQGSPTSPGSSRPSSLFPSAPASPSGTAKAIDRKGVLQASPRIKSGSAIVNDEKLDSLKQMFGVSRISSPGV